MTVELALSWPDFGNSRSVMATQRNRQLELLIELVELEHCRRVPAHLKTLKPPSSEQCTPATPSCRPCSAPATGDQQRSPQSARSRKKSVTIDCPARTEHAENSSSQSSRSGKLVRGLSDLSLKSKSQSDERGNESADDESSTSKVTTSKSSPKQSKEEDKASSTETSRQQTRVPTTCQSRLSTPFTSLEDGIKSTQAHLSERCRSLLWTRPSAVRYSFRDVDEEKEAARRGREHIEWKWRKTLKEREESRALAAQLAESRAEARRKMAMLKYSEWLSQKNHERREETRRNRKGPRLQPLADSAIDRRLRVGRWQSQPLNGMTLARRSPQPVDLERKRQLKLIRGTGFLGGGEAVWGSRLHEMSLAAEDPDEEPLRNITFDEWYTEMQRAEGRRRRQQKREWSASPPF